MASERDGKRPPQTWARIDAETQLVGVMGWPVAHSLSPAMHNAVLARLGLNWRYVPLPVHPSSVGDALRGAAALGFRGVNVTVPHKQAVMAALDEVAREAAAVGAVNTVVMSPDGREAVRLVGTNTDVAGFVGSLRAGGFEPAGGGRAVVVGAGGAARAVVYALLSAGMDRVVVMNRTPTRAETLVADFQTLGIAQGRLEASALTPERLLQAAEGADLLVNTTTLGMWPRTEDSIWPEGVAVPGSLVVYDLVYNPLETRLLRQARDSGARTIDGLGMLARQGALALAMWLDDPLDVEWATALMREACGHALSDRRNNSEVSAAV